MELIPSKLKFKKITKRRGSVVVTMPVMLGGLIFVAAIMVDIGSFYVNKSQMQNAADAAAIAAARMAASAGATADGGSRSG